MAMGPLSRITVKALMERYDISERTAVRWRRWFRRAGLLVATSPKGYSVVGDWSLIDQAVRVGILGRPALMVGSSPGAKSQY